MIAPRSAQALLFVSNCMRGVRMRRRCPPGRSCTPGNSRKKIRFDPDALGLTAAFSDGRLRGLAVVVRGTAPLNRRCDVPSVSPPDPHKRRLTFARLPLFARRHWQATLSTTASTA